MKIETTILAISSMLFSTIYAFNFGGVSVATADNADAISLNPAGLGIDRGYQSSIYIPIETDIPFKIFSSERHGNWGYSLEYSESDELFNPTNGTIGIGNSIFANAYAGLSWNKHGDLNWGLLYRPLSQISMGSSITLTDDLTSLTNVRGGIAIRPFLKHRLTFGTDLDITISDNSFDDIQQTLHPFMIIAPVDGITISASAKMDMSSSKFNTDDISISLGIDMGHGGAYASATGTDRLGLGFTVNSQQQGSILKKKDKEQLTFIRMKLGGLFIEEKPVEPPFKFEFNPFSGTQVSGIQLRTWIEEIDSYTEDPDIDGMIIDMGNVRAGFAKRGEIYAALKRFKNADKPIYVYADMGISNADYFLVSMANEIYLNEYTGIDLKGLRMEISFFRGLLDTLLIEPEVFRVEFDGKSYKTAADQFLNEKMSIEMRENYGDLLNDFYAYFLSGISEGRGWDEQHTQGVIDNGPYFRPQDAIAAGLADSIMYPDQFDDYIHDMNNKKVEIIKQSDIDRSDDFTHEWSPEQKEKIAIIYAVGGIQSGKSNPGPAGSTVMGDKTIVEAIKSAREDKDIKAILLRIDSGGGSALASDQMWREVLKTTEGDSSNVKPFIASMSDVAASGGYYIACQADTILAHPMTITGSIGVIGLRFNLSKLKSKWGITSDLIKKGTFSDFGSGNRLISDEERNKMQASINDVYDKFKRRVVAGRDNMMENADLDDVAMGRVFSGDRAKNDISIPLVDVTGGIHAAIELTKIAAGIEGSVEIIEYPQPEDPLKQLKSKLNTDYDVTNLLPEELKDDLAYIRMLQHVSRDGAMLLLPYKISIK